jgi:hypothetical protein
VPAATVDVAPCDRVAYIGEGFHVARRVPGEHDEIGVDPGSKHAGGSLTLKRAAGAVVSMHRMSVVLKPESASAVVTRQSSAGDTSLMEPCEVRRVWVTGEGFQMNGGFWRSGRLLKELSSAATTEEIGECEVHC